MSPCKPRTGAVAGKSPKKTKKDVNFDIFEEQFQDNEPTICQRCLFTYLFPHKMDKKCNKMMFDGKSCSNCATDKKRCEVLPNEFKEDMSAIIEMHQQYLTGKNIKIRLKNKESLLQEVKLLKTKFEEWEENTDKTPPGEVPETPKAATQVINLTDETPVGNTLESIKDAVKFMAETQDSIRLILDGIATSYKAIAQDVMVRNHYNSLECKKYTNYGYVASGYFSRENYKGNQNCRHKD